MELPAVISDVPNSKIVSIKHKTVLRQPAYTYSLQTRARQYVSHPSITLNKIRKQKGLFIEPLTDAQELFIYVAVFINNVNLYNLCYTYIHKGVHSSFHVPYAVKIIGV